MLLDIYKRNPKTITKIVAGFTGVGIGLGIAGIFSRKRPKFLITLGLLSGLIARIIYLKNRPIGIAGDPEDVITWLRLEGFERIPEKIIRETGHFYWG